MSSTLQFLALAGLLLAVSCGPVLPSTPAAPTTVVVTTPEATTVAAVTVTEAPTTVTTTTVKVPTVKFTTPAPYKFTKKYNPTRTPPAATTTTTTTTTTTVAPATVETALNVDETQTQTQTEVKLCTCEQVDKCSHEAYENMGECRTECQSHLTYFGDATEKLSQCFPEKMDEAKTTSTCLKSNVNDYCDDSTDASKVTMIPKPDYTTYFETYTTQDENNLKDTIKPIKDTREAFGNFRKFQSCVVKCYKKKQVACFEKVECGVQLPAKTELEALYDGCLLAKPQVLLSTFQTCNCLVQDHKVTKLKGICGLFSAVMRFI